MKKILSLILCSVVAISAVGCNENSENTSSPNSGTAENNSSAAGNSDTNSSAGNSESTSGTVEIFGRTYDIDTTTNLCFNFMILEAQIPSFRNAIKTKESAQQAFDDAIEAIKKLKNLEAISFKYDYQSDYMKYIDLSFLEELPKLKVLELTGRELTDSDCELVGRLTNLEMLSLNMIRISDITPLANLTNLKEMVLPYIEGFDTYSWLEENLPNCKSVSGLSYKFQIIVGIDNT